MINTLLKIVALMFLALGCKPIWASDQIPHKDKKK